MCGLFSWQLGKTNLSVEKRAMIAAVLSVGNTTRGSDSWGHYSPKDGITKGLGEITSIASSLVKQNNVFAHTRHGTCGAVTVANAHPFKFTGTNGTVIVSHNGIITNHSELNAKYGRSFEVDSMHLGAHLADGLPFEDIRGYGAILWVNEKHPERIYVCKLSGGELSVAGLGTIEKCKGVVISSDADHLTAALTAANLEHFAFEVKTGRVYYIEGGQFYYDGENTLELGKSYSESMPDWRMGMQNNPWIGKDDEEDESAESEFKRLMDVSGDDNDLTSEEIEEETGVTYKKFWEYENELRKAALKGVDSSEFDHTHDMNSGFDEEYVNGRWLKLDPRTGRYIEGMSSVKK